MSFLSVDGTLVVQLVNFAIFFAILNVVFLRPVAAAIRKRREYINSLVDDYDRYQAEATELRQRAESVRAAARREAAHRIATARAEATNEAAEIAARCTRQAQEIVEEATRAASAELDVARASEERAVRGLAQAMVERVMAESA